MNSLKIIKSRLTLVDQVEDKLLEYIREKDIRVGDSIPCEQELALSLGVARSVLREALSRLKMLGMIESRTRRGMLLCEPSLLIGFKRALDFRILSDRVLFDIIGFRMALEIGICSDVIRNITDEDIDELENIVQAGIVFDNNQYAPFSEFAFHAKIYQISGNKIIVEFQEIMQPVMDALKHKFSDLIEPLNIELRKSGKLVTHRDILDCLRVRDENAFKCAVENHFAVYVKLIKQSRI